MTIPSVGKAAPVPRKSAARETRPFGREGDRMPAPKGPYARARYNQVPERTRALASQCWMRRPEWPKKIVSRQLIGGTANHAD